MGFEGWSHKSPTPLTITVFKLGIFFRLLKTSKKTTFLYCNSLHLTHNRCQLTNIHYVILFCPICDENLFFLPSCLYAYPFLINFSDLTIFNFFANAFLNRINSLSNINHLSLYTYIIWCF